MTIWRHFEKSVRTRGALVMHDDPHSYLSLESLPDRIFLLHPLVRSDVGDTEMTGEDPVCFGPRTVSY